MDEFSEINKTEQDIKVFTPLVIGVCTYVGGLLTGGLLLFMNYRQLGKKKASMYTLFLTLLGILLYYYFLLELPRTLPPSVIKFVIPLIPLALVMGAVIVLQKQQIKQVLAAGGEQSSIALAAAFTIVGLIPMIVAFAMIAMPEGIMEGKMRVVGSLRHELYHEDLDERELRLVANVLERSGYFGDEQKNYAKAEKRGKDFHFLIPVEKSLWNDAATDGLIAGIKFDMLRSFPMRKATIAMFEDTETGRDSTLFAKFETPEFDWMRIPERKQTDLELLRRVELEVVFLHKLFTEVLEKEKEYVSLDYLPICMLFADNGVAILSYEDINKRTQKTFYDGDDMYKALTFLSDALEKTTWKKSDDVFESYVWILDDLIKNLRKMKERMKESEGGGKRIS
jgi:hypothetical protein